MPLKKAARQERVLEQFRSNPSIRLASLADRFAVTKETIRRDIDEASRPAGSWRAPTAVRCPRR